MRKWGARLVLMRNAEQGEWVAGRMGVCWGVMSEVGMGRRSGDGYGGGSGYL